jgi:cytochrome b561
MVNAEPVGRWNAVQQALHWLVVALILVQGGIGLVMVELPKRPSVFAVYNLHKSLGLTLLALALLRLGWRLAHRRPTHLSMPDWQRQASGLVQVLLYMLLFAVPLSGWLFDSSTGLRPLFWWGLVRMPSLTGGPAPDWRDALGGLHEVLFWSLVALAALHAAAALWHHAIKRDEILRRMLPGRRIP